MKTDDRQEYERQMSVLCAGMGVPMSKERSDAYWQGLAKMNLSAFARMVEHCLSEDGPDRFPTVKAVWQLSKKLKPARAQFQETAEPQKHWDPWLLRANLMLTDYIRKNVTRFGARYGAATCTLHAPPTVSPSMHERVGLLVKAKNLWALDMRESPESREPGYQKRLWAELMQAAEAEIDRLISDSHHTGELAHGT